ncbi:hypothetical protein O181_009716 [Austropuccinia psidii MF-1]|uniref:Reverse transcriptase domain-containing protein n=1 Tax=Austropuccinia psidii MF-1 TaxID=1389203 RepID=A0A9Q3BSD7_9BASI|nr:hypothetical protein [Austropuccinia psidii MF-1]
MDALKGFHQNALTPKSKKLLRTISHCGIYEYLRMPFGIKNAPSHYQRMTNTIFQTELSEGWLLAQVTEKCTPKDKAMHQSSLPIPILLINLK